MRLLFVVQRFGSEIAGGAEHLIREYAVRLTGRGHEVEVLTSCAHSYADWADIEAPGRSVDSGVVVHRLAVSARRDDRRFGPLHRRVTGPDGHHARRSPVVTSCWTRMIGPDLDGLTPWLRRNAERFDVVVFSGYLYSTSTQGLPAIGALVPTVLQPVAHDELTLRLPVMRELIDHAAGINFLTEEERDLVRRRFRPTAVTRVFGAGVGCPPDHLPDGARERFGLGTDPYLVCVGRVDPGKGMHELAGYFRTYRGRHEGPLRLVFVGSESHPLERHPDMVVTGFVDDATKWALIDGATVLVQPSYFESFSLSLAEGWRCAKPALVQGRSDVLLGQVRRSNGGLAYTSYAEFEVALELLLSSPERRANYGIGGRSYVERYNWETILPRFESLLSETHRSWHALNA